MRAAKGDSVVDCIKEVKEPSGTSATKLTETIKPEKKSKKRAKEDTTIVVDDGKNEVPPAKKIRKQVSEPQYWKKSFFNSIQTIEESRAQMVQKKDALEVYNIALKNLVLEKQLCKSSYS